jgi:hypothetical protein
MAPIIYRRKTRTFKRISRMTLQKKKYRRKEEKENWN